MLTAIPQKAYGARHQPVTWFSKVYVYPAATMLAIVGLLMILAAFDSIPQLTKVDELFGITTRIVLLLAGAAHLAVSGYLFIAHESLNSGIATFWIALYYILYCAGTDSLMNVARPIPAEVALAWKVGVSVKMLDMFWRFFVAYLTIGSMLLIVVEWRRLKHLRVQSFLEHWADLRERHFDLAKPKPRATLPIAAPAQANSDSFSGREGSASNRIPVSDFKFSCPACGQHILCGLVYSSTQIKCPACEHQILVPSASV